MHETRKIKDHHRERSHPGKKKGNNIYVKDYRREVIEQGGKGREREEGIEIKTKNDENCKINPIFHMQS